MTKSAREDYKIDRNKKIYEEYVTEGTSFNKLAKKYGVSPQRVRYLVNDYKDKGLGRSLVESDSIKKRNDYKNRAVELREEGKLKIAMTMFEDVLVWDVSHKNYRGQADVHGHIQIVYKKLAWQSKSAKDKLVNLKKAEEHLQKYLEVDKQEKLDKGLLSIQMVHLAGLKVYQSEITKPESAKALYKDALVLIEKALRDLPGSKAHRAWPLKIKAYCLQKIGKDKEALQTLQEAELDLGKGYWDELKEDLGQLNLRVWLGGLHITYALIYVDQKKYILAKHYANSVLTLDDPEKQLTNVKAQARKILSEI